jgi:predicted ester cyclase
MAEELPAARPARTTVVARLIELVWNGGDAAACAAFLAARYTIHHDPGDPWDGRVLDQDAYRQRLQVSRAPCPDQRFELLTLVDNPSDGSVLTTWSWTGTHTAPLAGFAPTGQRLRMSGATVYYFDPGDRITGHWQVVDRLSIFQQLRARAG